MEMEKQSHEFALGGYGITMSGRKRSVLDQLAREVGQRAHVVEGVRHQFPSRQLASPHPRQKNPPVLSMATTGRPSLA
jgi:hypothetical protein